MRSAPENVTPQELAALTTREREVIQAQLDGLNCAGISERLGTSRASVYVHASQARRRIAEMRLQPANDGAPDLWIAPEVSPWDSGDPASTATIARARLVAGRRDAGRSVTIAAKHLTREERRSVELVVYPDVERPRTRGDCVDGPRPCPFVSCSHHLYLDVSPIGSIKLNHPTREVWELAETCALDVADRGGVALEEVGEYLNLTRERVRQIEMSAARRAAESMPDEF